MTVPHNTVDSLFDAKTQFRDSTVFHKIVRNKKIATQECLLHLHVVKICLKYESEVLKFARCASRDFTRILILSIPRV